MKLSENAGRGGWRSMQRSMETNADWFGLPLLAMSDGVACAAALYFDDEDPDPTKRTTTASKFFLDKLIRNGGDQCRGAGRANEKTVEI